MRCISPITLKAKPSAFRTTQVVPCGKCLACLERRRNDWSIRLAEEYRGSDSAHFITLTYNDENIPYSEESGLPTLSKRDVTLFMKRLRSNLSKAGEYPNLLGKIVKKPKIHVKIKYFLQGEYGSNFNRPHYHMILFNFPMQYDYLIEYSWAKGFIHYGEVTQASIHYTTKYILSKLEGDFCGIQKPFALMSKGLGLTYAKRLFRYHNQNMVETYTAIGGEKFPLPRYIKDKLFTKVQQMEITAKTISYSARREAKQDNELRNTLNSDAEFFTVKHERLKSHVNIREKRLTKANKKL